MTRYNCIFVYSPKVDTKGLTYPKALNHLTVGIYIGQICLIGLFGVNKAGGPTILMVLSLVFSILFHIGLKNAYAPLLSTLPKSLELEEETLMTREKELGPSGSYANGSRTTDTMDSTGMQSSTAVPTPNKKPSFFAKFLRPDLYCDYQTLRRLVVQDHSHVTYTEEIERDAYHDPSVSMDTPLLWIPRDGMGISRQEVAHTSRSTPITDEGATIDDAGNIHWDPETRPPIHEEKIYY